MRREYLYLLAFIALTLPMRGAELAFDFESFPKNEPPPGFTNVLYGKGRVGEWKILMDDIPPMIEPATTKAPVVTRRAVLAQVSRNPTDERFPLLLYEKEIFGDFTLTTKFKMVDGVLEQLAGIVFRVQNETNFYVIRANAMDGTLRYYKVVNGLRTPMMGPKVEVPLNVWHELKIECQGNKIRAWLNGQEAISQIVDSSFLTGKIGYWTKSDAVSYFSDTKITYVPRESLAQALVRSTMERNPKLLGLKLTTLDANGTPRVEASSDPAELGLEEQDNAKRCILEGTVFFARGSKDVTVMMPMRDRNGEPMAAITFRMTTFRGQTEKNAIERALPMVKQMQRQSPAREDLTN